MLLRNKMSVNTECSWVDNLIWVQWEKHTFHTNKCTGTTVKPAEEEDTQHCQEPERRGEQRADAISKRPQTRVFSALQLFPLVSKLCQKFFFSFLMTFINNEGSNVKGYLERREVQKHFFPLQFWPVLEITKVKVLFAQLCPLRPRGL